MSQKEYLILTNDMFRTFIHCSRTSPNLWLTSYQTTRRHISDAGRPTLHNHRCKKLKPHKSNQFLDFHLETFHRSQPNRC